MIIKPGSQYDAGASECWDDDGIDSISIPCVVLSVLASIQPIRLLKKLTSGIEFY